ncbi:hypothetical protein [Lacrimispora saccharolytica]|uniref:Plasmid segregation centromere-binding protein ParR n=1 Tax=Lacrimispora saccharolytica (strain ATCC 35040 / DSM 2544 / NRCC 2533 / WM1) TaxID=610130 RepID=D9R7K5_LACSW|nr:hypothetical protein [Lacrimispora saccharolytica]ADL03734.1 hypothetical protein Closa_1118 [[Clostridium] saccharolyticum WM1]
MVAKKERGRFTLRLNEKDPAHAEVIRLLEQQDPHSKARFIANAILHYVHCSETPDISVRQMPDRAAIEAIVLDILRQQKGGTELTAEVSRSFVEQKEPAQKKPFLPPEPVADEPKSSDVDEDVRNMIKGTLSAFRINS